MSAPVSNPITEGVIWKQILFFFFPLLLSSFFQQLYNTADALIVGRIAGKEALSAVGGPAGSLLNIFIMFFIGFSGGASVPVAQYFGAKKEDTLRETIRVSLLICSVIGLIGAAICFGAARLILTAMRTPDDVLTPSLPYLHIVAPGLIPCAVYNMEAASLRAMGDSRRPLAVLVFTCLTNIVLDLFFVAVLGMGASGAAVATALCHLLSALLALFFLKRTLNGLSLTSSLRTPVTADLAGSVDEAVPADSVNMPVPADIAVPADMADTADSANMAAFTDLADSADPAVPAGGENTAEKTGRTKSGGKSQKIRIPSRPRIPKDIARRILRMGLPLGFSEVTFTFANLILMSVVNRLGTDTVAAYAAYGKIDAIFWMVVGSFGISITTFVGQNIGAGRWDRVMQSIRECALMMFLVMGVVIGTLYYFSYPLQHLFCTDLAVVEIGTHMMHFLMPFYFLYIPIEILFGSLRGMGDSVIPTLITFFGVCLLRSAWGLFIVPFHYTINMILLGFPVTWCVCDIAFLIYFRMYLRRRKPDSIED